MNWEFAARIYIECLKHGQDESARKGAESDLMDMARLVDKLQAERKVDALLECDEGPDEYTDDMFRNAACGL